VAHGSPPLDELHSVLDDFHAAAAEANEERYLARWSPAGVFLGTDPDDRWAGDTFTDFVHASFSRGRGWTYVVESRSVDVAEDGRTAWFDERLLNDSYGVCRGTGVLQRRDDGWKIEQYSLSVPIPDKIAGDVVARIRESAS
jgi:SnoaL-like domain